MDCRNCINGLYKPLGISYVLGLRKPISAIQSFQKEQRTLYAHRNEINSNDKYDFGFLLSAGLLISYLF